MKKIAHVCNTALSYKILVDKLNLLQQKGYEIHLISSSEGFDAELMENFNFEIKFVKMDRKIHVFRDIISILKLYKIFRLEKYDIVHTHTAKGGIIGRIAAFLARIPVIIHTSHGLPFYKGQNRLQFSLYYLLEKIGAYFCHSLLSQNKEDMLAMKSFNSKRSIHYEGNGVDLLRLDQIKESITLDELKRLRKQWGIQQNQKVILVGARFEPVKNHFLLLEGLKELKERYDDFICLLAGRGPLENQIIEKINLHGLNSNVKIIGHQINIYPYIELADIIALTSEKEGIPRIIMESMAFSKAVVATDVLGTRELLNDRETGLLIPYNNPKKLGLELYELVIDEELRLTYGKQARMHIEREFTEQIVVNRIDRIYKDMLSETGQEISKEHQLRMDEQ